MKLIGCRVNHRDRERDYRRFPKASSYHRPVMAQRAPEQSGEDRIFREVARLTHDELRQRDRSKGNMWIKPEEKRHEKTRRMLGRHQIGRAGKDQKHPCDNWHPLTDDSHNPHVQRNSNLFSLTQETNHPGGGLKNLKKQCHPEHSEGPHASE